MQEPRRPLHVEPPAHHHEQGGASGATHAHAGRSSGPPGGAYQIDGLPLGLLGVEQLGQPVVDTETRLQLLLDPLVAHGSGRRPTDNACAATRQPPNLNNRSLEHHACRRGRVGSGVGSARERAVCVVVWAESVQSYSRRLHIPSPISPSIQGRSERRSVHSGLSRPGGLFLIRPGV